MVVSEKKYLESPFLTSILHLQQYSLIDMMFLYILGIVLMEGEYDANIIVSTGVFIIWKV